jgi:hypothetical protein
VDDSPLIWRRPPDDRDDAELDHWLMTWFQLRLAEPVPLRFLDLIDRLDAASGM